GLFVPTAAPVAFEMALELDWPVDGLEPLSFLLARVLEPLCAGLAARGRRAATLTVDLGLVDGSTHRRALRPAAPSGEPRTWRTLVLLDLEAHPPRDAVQAITVRAGPTPTRSVQFSLLDPAQPSPERLAETMARLHSWTAAGRGGAAALLDTHRPGAFAVGTFAPGPVTPRAPAPGSPRVALRAFRPPRPARVALRDGAPAFVAAAGVRGAVVDHAGPWRARDPGDRRRPRRRGLAEPAPRPQRLDNLQPAERRKAPAADRGARHLRRPLHLFRVPLPGPRARQGAQHDEPPRPDVERRLGGPEPRLRGQRPELVRHVRQPRRGAGRRPDHPQRGREHGPRL